MKRKMKLLLLLLVLLTGCTQQLVADPEDLQTGADGQENDTGNSEEIPELIDNQDSALYLNLTDAQMSEINRMVEESGIYDSYTPKFDMLSVSSYRNTVEVLAQAKDFPTLLISRYEDVLFAETAFSYYVQRFYREDVDFTYEKDGAKRKANLELSYYVNQNNNMRYDWDNVYIECHLYVPNASGQTNYLFYYDPLYREIFVLNEKGEKEEIKFAKDLQEKVLKHCQELGNKLIDIDRGALKLARTIVDYLNEGK